MQIPEIKYLQSGEPVQPADGLAGEQSCAHRRHRAGECSQIPSTGTFLSTSTWIILSHRAPRFVLLPSAEGRSPHWLFLFPMLTLPHLILSLSKHSLSAFRSGKGKRFPCCQVCISSRFLPFLCPLSPALDTRGQATSSAARPGMVREAAAEHDGCFREGFFQEYKHSTAAFN